jgi:outer membrane autotransporter protein
MKRFINKFVFFNILIYLCPNSSYASPNFCIIGDNTTDCSSNPLDITSLTTGIINNGDILGDGNGWWGGIEHYGTAPNANPINGITNFGRITGHVVGIGIYGNAVISGGITNKNGATISGFAGIWTESTATINFINNAGSILGFNLNSSAGATDVFNGIENYGTINEITNTGTIASTRNLNVSYGILNDVNTGTITTLNNAQGAGNANGALTYNGALPTNYNIIINSPTSYGKLLVTNGTGSTNFGIYNGSTVANGTYSAVLSGLSSNKLVATTGSYNSKTWTLNNSSGNIWDLIISGVAGGGGSSSSSNYYLNTIANRSFPGANAAQVLDNLSANPGAMASVITALDGLSGVAQANAVTQTLPAIIGASNIVTTSSMQALNQVVQYRQSALRGMASGSDYIGNRDIWVKAYGSWANQNDLNGVAGYKINNGGLAIGLDKGLSPRMNLGTVFAFANSGVSSNSNTAPSSVNINSYQLGVYGDYVFQKNLIANAQLDIGMNQNNSYRNIVFMGTNAHANYNSYSGHIGTGIKYVKPINSRNTFIPSIRVDYTNVQSKGYNETGAGVLNLQVNSQTYNTLPVSVDFRIDHALRNKLTLSGNVGAGYNILNNQVSLTTAYQGGGSAFATNGLQVSPWIYNAGIELSGQMIKGLEINVRYDNIFSTTGYMNQMVSAKLKMPL